MKIYKYVLVITDNQIVELPIDSKIIHVAEQSGKLCIWVEIYSNSSESRSEPRTILSKGTGPEYEEDGREEHIGTVLMSSGLVWHVYEVNEG